MKEKIYLICYKNDYFRKGQIANIVGLKKVTTYSNNSFANIPINSKICYHIIFEDSQEDYIHIEDVEKDNWHFVTLAELLTVGMPK